MAIAVIVGWGEGGRWDDWINMPPNRTDEIQPLDVGVFGALQSMTDRDWETDNSIQDCLNDFQQACIDFSPVSIRQAFYSALVLEEGVLEDEEADKNTPQCIIDERNSINSINESLKMVIDAIPQ